MINDQNNNDYSPDQMADTNPEQTESEFSPIPLYKAPFAFFFAPGQFMLRNGVHTSELVLTLIIWISGMAMVIDRFEGSGITGRALPWVPEKWIELAVAAVIIGILRGFVVYGIGGWWFRIRLSMCGVKNQEWSITGRVYMISGIARHLATLLFIVIGAFSFPDFTQYTENIDGIMVIIAAVVTMTLLIWSSFTLYFGTRAIFPVKKITSLIWFLILPILLRTLALALVLGVAFWQELDADPMLDNPETHTSESFQFEYPSNWMVTLDEETPGPETWVQAEPVIADAFLESSIVYSSSDKDQIAIYLTSLEDENDMKMVSQREEINRFGQYDCKGFEYLILLQGSEYVLQVIEIQIGDGVALLTKILSEQSIWEKVKPGFEHVASTLKVTDPHDLPPVLTSTYTVRDDHVQFEMPINWWWSIDQADDTTNEDGSVSKGSIMIETQSPGYGYFRINIYESGIGPRAELAITIDDFASDGRLIDEQPIDQWLGLTGFGAQGKFTYNDDSSGSIKVIVTQLADGRTLEIKKIVPDEALDLQTPAFNLIESTFKLLADPAP